MSPLNYLSMSPMGMIRSGAAAMTAIANPGAPRHARTRSWRLDDNGVYPALLSDLDGPCDLAVLHLNLPSTRR
jgi:hypothetical protein